MPDDHEHECDICKKVYPCEEEDCQDTFPRLCDDCRDYYRGDEEAE
jgi:hypothetical protein